MNILVRCCQCIGQEVRGVAVSSAARQLLLTYLTEPLDIDQNEDMVKNEIVLLIPFSNARCMLT